MGSGALVFVLLILGWRGVMVLSDEGKCYFPAIFNFGDSNSDTGGLSAAFFQVPPPNGESFFEKPRGRVCDGRLLIDFIAESQGLPYLSAYLDSIGTNFRHGANFATGGSTIRPQNTTPFVRDFSPFSLDLQVWQFIQFKTRTSDLHSQGENSLYKDKYPKPEEFESALYVLDIGQNDLAAGFKSMSDDQLASIPEILNQFSQAIYNLYAMGARSFWIHNTGPVGCLPLSVMFYPLKPINLDQFGCVNPQNEVAKEFNRQLKDRVTQLRGQLPDAALTYVDVYTSKYALISEAQKQGFTDPLKFCCGRFGEGGRYVGCGEKVAVNGTELFGSACADPSKYVSWDGVHYTQAANQLVANRILNGDLSHNNVSVSQACYRSVQ